MSKNIRLKDTNGETLYPETDWSLILNKTSVSGLFIHQVHIATSTTSNSSTGHWYINILSTRPDEFTSLGDIINYYGYDPTTGDETEYSEPVFLNGYYKLTTGLSYGPRYFTVIRSTIPTGAQADPSYSGFYAINFTVSSSTVSMNALNLDSYYFISDTIYTL